MKTITGGVCAAKGFTANGIHCGVRKNRIKKDIALIYSEVPAKGAAVYTTNLVKGAPLTVTKSHLQNGVAQAVICNSGNANTCNANGIEVAEEMCKALAKELKISSDDVVVASTGVIGQPLNLEPIVTGIPALVAGLSVAGGSDAAEGIMTTDVMKKEIAVEFEIGGKICHMGGIAKGSGMIHPNMATQVPRRKERTGAAVPLHERTGLLRRQSTHHPHLQSPRRRAPYGADPRGVPLLRRGNQP